MKTSSNNLQPTKPLPIGSMYGIFTYIYYKHQPNVGKYTSPIDPMGFEELDKQTTRFSYLFRAPRFHYSTLEDSGRKQRFAMRKRLKKHPGSVKMLKSAPKSSL